MKRATIKFNCGISGLLLIIFFLVNLTSCGKTQEQPTTIIKDYKAEAEEASAYCVSKEDCYLCGGGINHLYWECLGQNNVGLVSLNTFQLYPIEINRYENGKLIEENVGYTRMSNFGGQDNGFSANINVTPDRGTASAEIRFNDDLELHLEKTAQHLCKDHFMELANDIYGNPYGIGIISFDKAKIHPLKEEIIGFQASDYSVICNEKENEKKGTKEMSIYIAFTPLRYSNKA